MATMSDPSVSPTAVPEGREGREAAPGTGLVRAVDRDAARTRALAFLHERLEPPVDIVVLDSHVVESLEAWFFPWNGRRWVEDRDFSAAYAGNIPVRVAKSDGTATFTMPDKWR